MRGRPAPADGADLAGGNSPHGLPPNLGQAIFEQPGGPRRWLRCKTVSRMLLTRMDALQGFARLLEGTVWAQLCGYGWLPLAEAFLTVGAPYSADGSAGEGGAGRAWAYEHAALSPIDAGAFGSGEGPRGAAA